MAFTILYTVEDGKGATSTFEINVPESFAFANVITFASNMATLFDAVMGGAIRRIGIAFSVPLPGGTQTVPGTNTDVEEGARFQFNTSGGFFSAFRLPTFLEDLFHVGTTVVDTTDSDVAAIVTAMTVGLDVDPGAGTILITPSDKREEDLVALDFAKEQFMSSRG